MNDDDAFLPLLGPVSFAPTDLGPLLNAWRQTVGSDPALVVRVTLEERFVLLLERPAAWNPSGWPRGFDLLDLTSEPVLQRLALPQGWRADEIVPGAVHFFLPKRSTLVGSVEPGGTMDRAGIVAGDRLAKIDGVAVATEEDVRGRFDEWLAEKKPLFAKRREVEIEFSRDGETHVVRVVPGTVQTTAGFVPALGYETGTDAGDTITPGETAYVAFEAVRQLLGGLPMRMFALFVPRDPLT